MDENQIFVGDDKCPNCHEPIISHSKEERKTCHDKLSGYERNTLCVVEVGIHERPHFQDKKTGLVVCGRHRIQYEQAYERGEFDWEEI